MVDFPDPMQQGREDVARQAEQAQADVSGAINRPQARMPLPGPVPTDAAYDDIGTRMRTTFPDRAPASAPVSPPPLPPIAPAPDPGLGEVRRAEGAANRYEGLAVAAEKSAQKDMQEYARLTEQERTRTNALADSLDKMASEMAALATQRDTAKAQAEKPIYETYRENKAKIDKMLAEPFAPTQDGLLDIAGIFGIVTVMGALAGKGSAGNPALASMNAMTGMMNGFKQGRADLFTREKTVFDENQKVLMGRLDALDKDLEIALKLSAYDLTAYQTKIDEIAAKYNSAVTTETIRREGIQGVIKARQHIADAKSKYAQTMAALAGKAEMRANSRTSALNQRFGWNMHEAYTQAQADVMNVLRSPAGTVMGAFADMAGKGGNTMGEALRNIAARQLTTNDQRQFQQLVSGLEFHMARMLGGGYANSSAGKMLDQYKTQLPRSGAEMATFLARVKQEMDLWAKAYSVYPGATPDQLVQIAAMKKQMDDAIPFTMEDVQNLRLGDRKTVIQREGERLQNAPTAYSDPEKERRYQEWKRANP